MNTTIGRLMNGDEDVAKQFVEARAKWEKILIDIDQVSVEVLSERITQVQFWFERNCGGRYEGQEIMVWSGFGQLYTKSDSGYLGKAGDKLAQAFTKSTCSMEVKAHARDAAKFHEV